MTNNGKKGAHVRIDVSVGPVIVSIWTDTIDCRNIDYLSDFYSSNAALRQGNI